MAVTGQIAEQVADTHPSPVGRLTEQSSAGTTAVGRFTEAWASSVRPVGRITEHAAYVGGGSTATGRITEAYAVTTIVPGAPSAMSAAIGHAWIPYYLHVSDGSGEWK